MNVTGGPCVVVESAAAASLGRLPPMRRLLAGVSGGADSTAMLAVLAKLRERYGFELICCHVNHGIRPVSECAADQAFVESLCVRLSVACSILPIPAGAIQDFARAHGTGIEDAARRFRHELLEAEAVGRNADGIALAHTQDDQLETVLMRLLKGSGPAGLAGIRERRGLVIHPFLALARHQILDYLESRGLPFRVDPSNADTVFLRNRIRAALVPVLDNAFDGWRKGLLRTRGVQEAVTGFLAAEAEARIPWHGSEDLPPRLETDARLFFSMPRELRVEALFRAYDQLVASIDRTGEPSCDPLPVAVRSPSRSTLEAFAAGDTASCDLGLVRVQRSDERVTVLLTLEVRSVSGYAVMVDGFCDGSAPGFRFRVSSIDTDDSVGAQLPLTVRSLCVGDGARMRTEIGYRGPSSQVVGLVEDREGLRALVLRDDPHGYILKGTAAIRDPGAPLPVAFFSIV